MHVFETTVQPGREAEHFTTAVYRFIELKGAADTEFSMIVRSEPLGDRERKVVTLWSETAAADFQSFWSGFKLERPASLPPRSRLAEQGAYA